jgi:hypothetical protein
VVREATAKCHRAAHRSRDAGGFAVAVVNPLRSRLCAEAVEALEKTDGVNCRMPAILGESLEPGASAAPGELMEGLQDLLRCRDAAFDARTALLNQLGGTTATQARRNDGLRANRSGGDLIDGAAYDENSVTFSAHFWRTRMPVGTSLAYCVLRGKCFYCPPGRAEAARRSRGAAWLIRLEFTSQSSAELHRL